MLSIKNLNISLSFSNSSIFRKLKAMRLAGNFSSTVYHLSYELGLHVLINVLIKDKLQMFTN